MPGISNSAGNLSHHLAGNLRHFIGAVLGNTGYIRDRELEFSSQHANVKLLQALIDSTISEITPVLDQLDTEKLSEEFPKEISGIKRDTLFVLFHLITHLSCHLGQINYHRRMISTHEM